MPSRSSAKLLERRLSASASIASVIAAVAASLSSSGAKIVSSSCASRKRFSNVDDDAPWVAWLSARFLRGDVRVGSDICVSLNSIGCVAVPVPLPRRRFEEDVTVVPAGRFVGGFVALGGILI
jgi:hypothetical protein